MSPAGATRGWLTRSTALLPPRRRSLSRCAAMALAASTRRSLASRLSGHIHPALPHLFTAHRSGDAATAATPSPLHPPQPLFRSSQFPLAQSSGSAAQTLTRFPSGIHLAAAGLSRRGFSSLPPYRVADAGAVLTDAAAAPVAPTNIPSEVASVAGDSSLSVEAVQNLISAVHSFTGLNLWLSIAVSTVLLRSVLFTLMITFRKQILVAREELSAITKLTKSAKDEKSEQEAEERMLSFCKSFGPLAFIGMLTPYTFMSLYFAISNMVQKLPSLKEGGAFWFTDLTTPDALFIFPAMVSLSMLLRLEFLLHYSKTKRSRRKTDFVRILLVLTFPFAATFPEAICCYLVTWSLTSLAQLIVIHQPAVKKLLFNKANSPTGPSSQAPTGPTAEDSPCPVDENEQTLHPERREASDSSVDQDRDQSDTKPEKDK